MKILIIIFSCLAVLPRAHAADTETTAADTQSPATDAPPSEPAKKPHASEGLSDSALNISGIFNSELPGIERKYHLKLILHPHIGDLTQYDYMRTAIGLRYSLSTHLELSAATNAYFGTGLRDAKFFEDYGLVDAFLGFKYRLRIHPIHGWETGTGISYQVPISNPPPQLTDGLEHIRSFITIARPLEDHPNWRVFWKVGADLVTPTSIGGKHETNALTDDSTSIGGGFVWHHGSMYYTFEGGYGTTRLLGTTQDDVFLIRPGIVWEIPRRYTQSSRTQWVAGLALGMTQGPDGFDVGLSVKLRLDLDLKRYLHRDKDASARP